ncbi:MAG: BlaI/MecI/CopY family transcriptional regulator [Gemmatimonadetes bacterium]|nr:BlaI/MecI/CopY family transcriptional regulator [Gemmatimonadota bacterium]
MRKRPQLGDLEEIVLLAVLRLGKDAYGARIRARLHDDAGRDLSISTVYVTLMRLEEKGLVRSWLGEPTSTRGGRAKRHFAVHPEGVAALESVREVRDRMWKGVGAAGGRAHAR